ncbi:hypothetical protein FGU65_11995 [Methanoculleus sp. FWC-SCC1]|uniref:Uncharacterized protein n=1 Tax=Methanoculleus frigidifontis TaxID=2584085 RepID=A0ABT8MCE3_9EURY|nr:hypothetical protein [Methanoculleus sp. FWC-SCC1]MDN7025603.1 hypothetical protein [Methanoculleus sp. FWC-SCC1]
MNCRPIITIFLLLLLAGVAAAESMPVIPAQYQGCAAIDGGDAPTGTVIVAKINWNERGRFTLTEPGVFPSRLIVRATEFDFVASDAPTVTFWAGANRANLEVPYVPGDARTLDLAFTTGSGGDGADAPIASGDVSFAPGGLETTTAGGKQQVTINRQNTTANVTTSGNRIVMQDTGGGWEEIVIETEGEPAVGETTVAGTVAGVSGRTSPVSANVDATVGTASAQISVNMSEMPPSGAQLTTTIAREPDPAAQSAFLLTAQQSGSGITDVAYVMNVQKTNVANAGDGGVITAATIRMTVSPAWVTAVGGIENVVIMRQADDGTTSALATTLVGTDGAGNYVFEALSPNGLSVFALIGTSTVSPTPTTPSGGGGSGGGGGSTGRSSFEYNPDATVTTPATTPVSSEATAAATPSAQQTAASAVAAAEATTASGGSWFPLQIPIPAWVPVLALGLLFLLRRR